VLFFPLLQLRRHIPRLPVTGINIGNITQPLPLYPHFNLSPQGQITVPVIEANQSYSTTLSPFHQLQSHLDSAGASSLSSLLPLHL